MRKLITSVGLSLAIGLGSFAATTAPSLSQGFEIQIGPDGVRTRERVEPRARQGCSERQALSAAREEGLRNAEIVRITQRSITVEGDTRRGVRTLRFANERGCPLI